MYENSNHSTSPAVGSSNSQGRGSSNTENCTTLQRTSVVHRNCTTSSVVHVQPLPSSTAMLGRAIFERVPLPFPFTNSYIYTVNYNYMHDHSAISQHQPHATLSVCPLMELTFSPCMDLHMYTSGWTCMKWTGGVVRGGHTQGGSRNTPLALLTGHFHFNTHTISVRG